MTIRMSRRNLPRATACVFTLALTLAPLLAPPPGGSAFAATTERVVDARRIVAVGGSITEIMFAIGEQDRLVARDSTSQYPKEAFELPDVGYMRRLSPEGVLSVEPDAILMLEGSGPPEAIDVLAKASIPLVTIPETFDRNGILAKIRSVGKAIGEEAKAEELAAKVGADLDAAQALTANVGERQRVLFVLSLQGGKVLASGSNTAANGLIELAGGVNAVQGFEGYKQLTDEAVIEAAPDVILMMARSDGLDIDQAELFAQPALASTPAARNKRLVRMDGLYLLGFGPRTAEAVRDAARQFYGDRISN